MIKKSFALLIMVCFGFGCSEVDRTLVKHTDEKSGGTWEVVSSGKKAVRELRIKDANGQCVGRVLLITPN